jgi:metal-sulfur cluster biosynthetic enzyme
MCSKIESIPSVAEADAELTFDPPWNHSMMSDVAKLETGYVTSGLMLVIPAKAGIHLLLLLQFKINGSSFADDGV